MRVLALIICFWTCLTGLALAQVLSAVDFDVKGEATQVWLTFDAPVKNAPKFFSIDTGTPRYVADFKDASTRIKGQAVPGGQIKIDGEGAVASLRYAKRGEAGLRLVFDLAPGASIKSQSITDTLVKLSFVSGVAEIDIPLAAIVPEVAAVQPVTRQTGIREFAGLPYPRLSPTRTANPVRRPIIVIDPGHGGNDPGALGTNGALEKNITFKSAKELQKQLLATKRYQVMLTRSKDVYVDHEERLRIARAGGADLFISIHADSAGNTSARGASVYTLSDRSKGRSRNVINTQNWVMEVDLNEQTDPVGNILVDLAQRKTASQSAQFADVLLPHLQGSTKLVGNSHRRAGYFVLLAPDVPAVLLEMGFLSNSDDETLLKTEKHRKKMMKAVTEAINTYFDNQTP